MRGGTSYVSSYLMKSLGRWRPGRDIRQSVSPTVTPFPIKVFSQSIVRSLEPLDDSSSNDFSYLKTRGSTILHSDCSPFKIIPQDLPYHGKDIMCRPPSYYEPLPTHPLTEVFYKQPWDTLDLSLTLQIPAMPPSGTMVTLLL